MKLNSWLRVTPEDMDFVQRTALKNKLTINNPEYVTNKRMGFSVKGVDRFQELYVEDGETLLVPRNFPVNYNRELIVDEREDGQDIEFNTNIVLGPTETRPEDQKKFVEDLTTATKNSFGAIGKAGPGYGKTVCGIEVIRRLGKTTAILVHKEFLIDQWRERILEFTDLEPTDIGVVWQDKCEFFNKKVVLIMAQSLLSTKEYPEAMYKYFGTLMVDEVHRFAAEQFRKAVTKFPAKYRVGLSATPKRKDGLEKVFYWHIGRIAAEGARRQAKPRIEIVESGLNLNAYQDKSIRRYDGTIDYNKMISFLTEQDRRNRIGVKLMLDALEAGERKILVLSARRDHLKVLERLLKLGFKKRNLKATVGYYIGGMDKVQRKIAEKRAVLLATYQMAKEGLDIPELNTLFFMTPVGDIAQATGRVIRTTGVGKEAVVVDITDNNIPLAYGLAQKRLKQYKKLGYL